MKGNNACLEFIRHLGPGLGLAPNKGLGQRIPGAAQVVGTQHGTAKSTPVVGHAPHRYATKPHPMKTALAAHKKRALSLTHGLPISQCDLHGRVAGLRATVDQKDTVQAFGGQVCNAFR